MNIDRFALGGSRASISYQVPKWRIPDAILLLVFMVLSYPVYYQKPFERQFYLNDITISHPYALHQRVSDLMLVIYSLIFPAIAIVIVWFLLADPRHKWYLLYISLLGLMMSWFTTSLFTNFVKNWIGRLRPDFIDRCQPKPNLPVNTLFTASEVCTTENMDILYDGFRTTPSGHSSESFAGLGYLYLWLCGQLLTEHFQTGLWRKIVAMLPLLGASLIALSRTQDYRHHFIDVLIGAIVGYFVAHMVYRRNFPSIDSQVPFKPLLDDSDVTFDVASTQQNNDDEEMNPLTTEEAHNVETNTPVTNN